MLYKRNRNFSLIWRIIICSTICLSLQNAIPCSTTSHFAKDNVNETALHAKNIKEFIVNGNNDNNIALTELDQMILMLRNVSTNIIFVTDYVFAPTQSSGGYAYSIAQPSSLPISSSTCIATTHTYLRPFTFVEFMQSFTILYEFECEARESNTSQMNETMCIKKYEVNSQYGWLDLRSSCFVLLNETNNDSTDATASSSSSEKKKKNCKWKFESHAKNCIEGEKEALFMVDAILNEYGCPSAKTADNKQSCPSESIGTNSTRYTTNVIFKDFINNYLPRRELLHETIADGVDFVTSVLVTRITLRETLQQLETNIDTANYMDDTLIYQRNVFNEWRTHFFNFYAPRMHTKWKNLQRFAEETITSAEVSGERLLREYSNKQTSVNNIYTSNSDSRRESIVNCANGEVYYDYKRSYCKDNNFLNSKMLSTELSSVTFQNSKFTCPLVDYMSLFNFSLELSLEQLNASLFAEQTLQTLEYFLEQVQTINFQEKAQGIQLLQSMFCFCVSHLITSIAMLDETFVTAELTSRTLQPLEHTFDWLLEYLEKLDVAKSLAELNEFHEHIRTTKETYLSLMHASLGVTFVDCVFNVINASTPIIKQSTSSLKEFDSSEYYEYSEVLKPVPLNTCVESILQAYGLLPNVSVDTEVNWSFQDENVKNDIVDYVNNLVQHSYHFTVNNSDNNDDDQIINVTISTVSEYIKGNANQERYMSEYCDKRTLNENANVCENELDECGYFSPALLFPSYTNVTLPIGYATMNSDCGNVNETCTCDMNTIDNKNNLYCTLPNFTSVVQELLCEPGMYFAMNTQSCSPCKVLQINYYAESNEEYVTNKQSQEFNKTMMQMTTMMMKMGTSVEFDNTFTDFITTLLTQRTNRQLRGVTSKEINAPFATNNVVSSAFSFCPGDGEMHQCPRLTSNNAVYAEAVQDINRTLPRTACRYYCNHSRYAPLHNGCSSTPQYYFNISTWHTERCVLSELIYRSGGAGVVVGSGVANIATSCPVMLREKYWSNSLHSNITNEFLPFVRYELHTSSFSSSSSSYSSSCTMNEMSTMWTIQLSSINFTLLRVMHIAAGKANACETNQEEHLQKLEDFNQDNTHDKKIENLSKLFKEEQLSNPTQLKHLLASFRPENSTNDFEETPYWSFYLVTVHTQEQSSDVYTAYFYLETNTVYTSFSTTKSKAILTNNDTIIHVRQGSTLSDNYHSPFSVRGVSDDDICSKKDNLYKENVEYSISDDTDDEKNEQMYSAIKSDEWLLSENDTMTMWNWSIMWEMSDRGKSVRFFVNDMQIGNAIPVRLRLNIIKQTSMSTRPMHLAFGGEVLFSMANESLQFATRDRNNKYNKNSKSNYYCEYEHNNMNNNNNNSKGVSNINNTSCNIIVPLPTFADFMPAKMIAFTRTFNAQLPTQKLARVSFNNIKRQREHEFNNTARYLEKLNANELLTYSSFSADEMWSRSAQLINLATAITHSMSHACRSGYGVNGKVTKKLSSNNVANNATLCLPCPLASYTETQFTSHFTTWENLLEANQSLCTCIDTWQWRNSSMTCILRAVGNGQPYMQLEQITFVIPDNVICHQCLEEQRMYETLTSYATSSHLSNPNTSCILLGWSAVLMPSNIPNTYLPDVNEQSIRKSYECSSNAVRIDNYESVNDAFFTNNIILYSSAASGFATETCRIYAWVSSESTRPSKAINRTVYFVMRPNSLMPWNVNVKNLTSIMYNQRVLVASITDYNMFPEFSLQSILKLQQLSANELAIITQALQNTIVQLEVNCSDAHMHQQSQNAMSKHASYKKIKKFINDIIKKRTTNNVINTSFANDSVVNIFNNVYYFDGLFFIPLTSADDACMFTWTVRSNSSTREKTYNNIKDDTDVDGGDGTSPFIVSHGLRIVTLPWRVHTSFQSNATAVNTKWITSTNNQFTISSIHFQFDITSIAQNSDLITVAFILVTFIILLMYYRNSHTSTRHLLLNAKATS